jgi:hypothetical protein
LNARILFITLIEYLYHLIIIWNGVFRIA